MRCLASPLLLHRLYGERVYCNHIADTQRPFVLVQRAEHRKVWSVPRQRPVPAPARATNITTQTSPRSAHIDINHTSPQIENGLWMRSDRKKTPVWAPFHTETRTFTKTGSGQT